MLFQENGKLPGFEHLRPKWSSPTEFLDHCSEFDGSERPADGNRAPVSPLIQSLAPLFTHDLTFQGAISALDDYARAKKEISGRRSRHQEQCTCLPWGPVSTHADAFVQEPARIAMFTTATKNSKNLFGHTYSSEDQTVYDRAYNLSLQDKFHYCARHGYDWHVFAETVANRSIGWTRMPAALTLLGQYEWVFHIDLDSVIMDHSVKLEEFLDPRYDLVIGVDGNGINNGVFCLRNSTWSRMLYAEAWTRTDVPYNQYWYEQAALMSIMSESHGVRNHMKLVPQEHFNTYLGPGDSLPLHNKEPFILHFPGRGDKWAMVERFMDQRRNVVET